MEGIPKHEQLLVLMDANARTRRREKGEVGSKDIKILGEPLLSFANNHDLAHANTFFSTRKGGESHTFKGRGKKRNDYILTRQHDRKLVRNVTVHPQPSFLPILDHNIVPAPVNLIGHFDRNRRLRTSAKPPVDRSRRLVTDSQLRQEVATVVRRQWLLRKQWGRTAFPVELLKFGLQQDRTILLEFHRLITLIWRDGKIPQQ